MQVLTEEVGGNVISLMPVGKGQKAIYVGRDNFRQSEIADDVINKLEEAKGDFVCQPALDELKAFAKKYCQ